MTGHEKKSHRQNRPTELGLADIMLKISPAEVGQSDPNLQQGMGASAADGRHHLIHSRPGQCLGVHRPPWAIAERVGYTAAVKNVMFGYLFGWAGKYLIRRIPAVDLFIRSGHQPFVQLTNCLSTITAHITVDVSIMMVV